VTELAACAAETVLIVAFDAERLADHIRHLLPAAAEITTLDAMRLPNDMLSNPARYLDPLNFATNFAFFRDTDGEHSRLCTANYWSGYGAEDVNLWLRLFDGDGEVLATWREPAPANAGSIVIDSRAVRQRFKLGDFTGQLFLHATGIRGHDVVKYALDTFGDESTMLSCTHDANAWPADLFAGLPAPQPGEKVVLWIQNSHPCPIPPGAIGLNLMGSPEIVGLDRAVGPFASTAVDTAELLPEALWPQQFELQAGRHIVRPRYEITSPAGRRRIAHVNVERTDLEPDPELANIANLMGKGYILPAPVLPIAHWRTTVLPTPMATCQRELPIAALIHDAKGGEAAVYGFGRLARADSVAIDLEEVLADRGATLPSGYGHVELIYDFTDGGEADGWLHSIFRYQDKHSGHTAETSFGTHMFNTVLTYRNEPQSYAGPAPGLSTRLFLRLGTTPHDTMCHLIYPASTAWHRHSETSLALHDGAGEEVACEQVEIPCGGSLLWRYSEMFGAGARRRAGDQPYVTIRDTTCRLFGYHGLTNRDDAFSFDHMFGF
jgi:hypothetical protein